MCGALLTLCDVIVHHIDQRLPSQGRNKSGKLAGVLFCQFVQFVMTMATNTCAKPKYVHGVISRSPQQKTQSYRLG